MLPAYCYPRYAIAAAVDLLNEPVEVRPRTSLGRLYGD